MDKLGCLILLLSVCCVYSTIDIIEVIGPNSVEYGTTEEVILDCKFQADNVTDIVVKWFYNGSIPIYQWITEKNPSGQAMGRLRNRIDTNFTVTNDSTTMYRALRFFNITTDLTGNYTCRVSANEDEDSVTKQLIIYIPPKTGLDIFLLEEDNTVICAVQGVFPEPEVNLHLIEGNSNKTDVDEFTVNTTAKYQQDDSGLYNVTKIYTFQNLSVTFTENVKFICDLNIPGTNYFLTQSVTYKTVEVIDEEENIWNSTSTISTITINTTEGYYYHANTTKGNTGVTNTPWLGVSAFFTILTLVLCK